MLDKPKLLVVHTKSGCCFWRAWKPAEEMRRQGLVEVKYLEPKTMSAAEFAEKARWCDIIHHRGLVGMDGLKMLRSYQELGRKVTADFDDLHFNVSPFNRAYKEFGVEEVQVRNPATGDVQYLWKDGKDGFNLKANQMKFHAYKTILQELDLITVTTLHLKKAMAEISGREDNIRVLPNAIDLTQWRPLDGIREKLPGKFRFGWAVSNSHAEDFFFIKPALVKFLETHPDAVFVCIGDASMDIKQCLPKGQVEWYPFSDLWEGHYQLRMSMLGLDVAIAPLADTEFNKCKSPLKYAEYTAFGWPVVAQNMTPYKEHIISGETGMLAGSPDEWVTALNTLYEKPDLRRKLHFNAMFTLREMFDLKKVAQDWAAVYKNVIYDGAVTK
jgi:glycosyltransferase involved in cell wall biosynthesis